MAFLQAVFTGLKFMFGLGALVTLIGIGFVLLWFVLRLGVRYALRHQPSERCPRLRHFFLEPSA